MEGSGIGEVLAGAEARTVEGHEEWVVTFQNATEFDASRRTLYVFLTESGDYIATISTANEYSSRPLLLGR